MVRFARRVAQVSDGRPDLMAVAAQPEITAYDGRRYLGGFNDRGVEGLFCVDADGRKLGKPVPRPRDAIAMLVKAAKANPETLH
jgi:hypothetical protein